MKPHRPWLDKAIAYGVALVVLSLGGIAGLHMLDAQAAQIGGRISNPYIDPLHTHDHGATTGLADDDHPQYLLADGTRTAASLNVTGTLSAGSIAASGALSAGSVTTAGVVTAGGVETVGIVNAGGVVTSGVGSLTGNLFLNAFGNPVVAVGADTLVIRDTGADRPILSLDGTASTRNAYLWANDPGGYLELVSEQHGDLVRLRGESAGGVLRDLFVADPDASATIYHAGGARLATTSAGLAVTGDIAMGANNVISAGAAVNALKIDNSSDNQAQLSHGGGVVVFIDADNTSGNASFRVIRDGADDDDLTAVVVLQVSESGDADLLSQEVYLPELAYLRTNGSGTILDDQNVASVTDNAGVGDWTVNFDAGSFSGTPVCTCTASDPGECTIGATQSASAYDIRTRNSAGTGADLGFYLTCLHTQQN